MTQPAETDVVVVGAGPVGLFAVFELGLFDMRCHLIDGLDRPGGQCTELYPDKLIYDIPAMTSIAAQALVDRLLEQIAPFRPAFSFGQSATILERPESGGFRVTTDGGEVIEGKAVVVAAGGGSLQPGRPSGPAARPSPIAGWGLNMNDNLVPVDAGTFGTSAPGVFAIGDVSIYPGKLRLILSGFHEAALMAQAARRIVVPDGRAPFRYTTSSASLRKKLGVA